MLRAVVLIQYRRVTDGRTDRQTDGIAIAGAALTMRALRRAVKISKNPVICFLDTVYKYQIDLPVVKFSLAKM